MKYRLTILFFLTLSISFGQNEDSLLTVLKSIDIEALKHSENQKEYLEMVFDLDQSIRISFDRIQQEFGRESKETDSIIKKWREIDEVLFKSMVQYLRSHSYPEKNLGEIPCFTPQLVFHHVSGTEDELELKREFFPMFYKAYRTGVIDEGAIYFYLYRFYGQIFKEQYDSDLGQVEQIEDLINKLELETE
ncbi:hypothetical protein [Fluviicola taffensis]|uniref:Uncharacterized protein n=1 Tax=Fluviicola taffensis (strain DSM 16823 / NCIMB 13979 / RW262) TaxID=755732 RepID=F2IEU1_FLUTR|nr:hypothetical protein [Fluviicola taffensis]AEA45658.1 hypothetical protein Fluta_3690 [Fluviicola taffensis DSM 16823]